MIDNAPGVSRQWSALPVATIPMLSLTNVTSYKCLVYLGVKTIKHALGGMSAMFTIQSLIADWLRCHEVTSVSRVTWPHLNSWQAPSLRVTVTKCGAGAWQSSRHRKLNPSPPFLVPVPMIGRSVCLLALHCEGSGDHMRESYDDNVTQGLTNEGILQAVIHSGWHPTLSNTNTSLERGANKYRDIWNVFTLLYTVDTSTIPC